MTTEMHPTTQADTLFGSGRKQEQFIQQPYRPQLQDYLSTHHGRLTPGGTSHPESHTLVQGVERYTAEFLKSSDIGASFISAPEFQSIAQREKRELLGDCAVAFFICIDGRIVRVLYGSPIFDISETKAGLVPTTNSLLDGELELSSPRIIEAIIDRPGKERSEILQISAGHGDSSKPGEDDCAAVLEMIEKGILPNDGTHKEVFTKMLADTVTAVGATYNRSARARGAQELLNVGLTAKIDTRTAGLIFGENQHQLNTTELVKKISTSDHLDTVHRLGQPGIFRHNFTDPATLLSRENAIFNGAKVLLRQSKIFNQTVDKFIESNMEGFTAKQKRAFKGVVGRTVAFQHTTGLYHGGETPISRHNEQYIATSTNGLRVGQNSPDIQSFGANVASYTDSVKHFETKVKLADKIGKMRSPHIAFISESQPARSSDSSDRTTRAKLRAHRDELLRSPDLRERIMAGNLWVIPTILQEKTGITKAIPNIAI